MLTNFTNHPIEIQKGQALGDVEACLFGNMVFNADISINWANLHCPTRQLKKLTTTRTRPLKQSSISGYGEPENYYEDQLSFDTYGREKDRPPRSISEAEVLKILGRLDHRRPGDHFPDEDEGEQIPMAPIPEFGPTATTPQEMRAMADISPHLSK